MDTHTTEFGEVYRMIDEVEDRQTPLQLKMEELGRKLTIFSFGMHLRTTGEVHSLLSCRGDWSDCGDWDAAATTVH